MDRFVEPHPLAEGVATRTGHQLGVRHCGDGVARHKVGEPVGHDGDDQQDGDRDEQAPQDVLLHGLLERWGAPVNPGLPPTGSD